MEAGGWRGTATGANLAVFPLLFLFCAQRQWLTAEHPPARCLVPLGFHSRSRLEKKKREGKRKGSQKSSEQWVLPLLVLGTDFLLGCPQSDGASTQQRAVGRSQCRGPRQSCSDVAAHSGETFGLLRVSQGWLGSFQLLAHVRSCRSWLFVCPGGNVPPSTLHARMLLGSRRLNLKDWCHLRTE